MFHIKELNPIITNLGNSSAFTLKFNGSNIKLGNSKEVLSPWSLGRESLNKQEVYCLTPIVSQFFRELINSFSTLPDIEQVDIIKRFDNLNY